MSRELTIEVPFDIPQGKREVFHFMHWLRASAGNLGVWGEAGREVGIGFTWYTRTGFDNAKLPVLVRRVKRALRTASIVFGHCAPYKLEQKIIYVRDGDGHGLLTFREE